MLAMLPPKCHEALDMTVPDSAGHLERHCNASASHFSTSVDWKVKFPYIRFP
jgi:hypothetical protein